jgi:hypothetical protein
VISRRTLLGAAGLAVAGSTGLTVGWLGPRPPRGGPSAPAWLIDAARREHDLLAGLDTALSARPGDTLLGALRADHAAHVQTFDAALGGYPDSVAVASSGVTVQPTRAMLRDAEVAAARDFARAAGVHVGAVAAVLASVAACEWTHVELLT